MSPPLKTVFLAFLYLLSDNDFTLIDLQGGLKVAGNISAGFFPVFSDII
jgi:hypothetical protein